MSHLCVIKIHFMRKVSELSPRCERRTPESNNVSRKEARKLQGDKEQSREVKMEKTSK